MRFFSLLFVFFIAFSAYSLEKPYRITISDSNDIETIKQYNVTIDNAGKNWIKIYSDPSVINELIRNDFEITELIDTSGINMELYRSLDDWGAYHTYSEVIDYLDNLHSSFSSLSSLYSLGRSINDNEIWCLKISDNIELTENEPEVIYISTIHGNEPVGTELLLAYADSLLSLYGSDHRITRIVDSCEIYIVPLMNPDGYIAGTRRNMNDVDLNRNFPVPDSGIGDDGSYIIEQENQVLISFLQDRNSSITVNFHTGATVVNYPWDYIPDLSPDDSLYIRCALDYSSRNPMMYYSSRFPMGITNGFDWYEVDGTFQDWHYWYKGDLHLTVELYDTKWPSASILGNIWDDNYDSFIALAEQTLTGIHGIVTDSLTGLPLEAVITINDIGQTFYADPDGGDYHRQLIPGSYSFTYECFGYHSKTIDSIVILDSIRTDLDIELTHINTSTISGYAVKPYESDNSGILVKISSSDCDSIYTVISGYYEIDDIYPGDYLISASYPGYRDSIIILNIIEGDDVELDFLLFPYDTLYFSDFESDSGFLSTISYEHEMDWEWGSPTTGPSSPFSGSKVWATKLNSDYSNSSQSRLSLDVDLTEYSEAILCFEHWFEFQPMSYGTFYDGANVKWYNDIEATVLIPSSGYNGIIPSWNIFIPDQQCFGGSSDGWKNIQIDLSPFSYSSGNIFFDFGSSSSITRTGWYIDDIAILTPDFSFILDIDETTSNYDKSNNIGIFPNPFNSSVSIDVEYAEQVKIFNINGECVLEKHDCCDFLWQPSNNTPSGVYLIEIKKNNKFYSSKLLYCR